MLDQAAWRGQNLPLARRVRLQKRLFRSCPGCGTTSIPRWRMRCPKCDTSLRLKNPTGDEITRFNADWAVYTGRLADQVKRNRKIAAKAAGEARKAKRLAAAAALSPVDRTLKRLHSEAEVMLARTKHWSRRAKLAATKEEFYAKKAAKLLVRIDTINKRRTMLAGETPKGPDGK